MPTGSISALIPASSRAVFDLLHNYERRLEWDTLLQSARLDEGFAEAALHATSVCRGKWYLGGFALRTEYVAFHPGSLAAVKMINQPPFFESFGASTRHEDISPGESTITYRFNFTAKPKWVQFVLHPVMMLIFRLEMAKRLQALGAYFRRVPDSRN